MSDKVKLIIEIPKVPKNDHERWVLAHGIQLDDVKAEIEQNAYPIVHGVNNHEKGMTLYGILQVLDNIGKGIRNDKEQYLEIHYKSQKP